jgi:aromatic ring hydroxylase
MRGGLLARIEVPAFRADYAGGARNHDERSMTCSAKLKVEVTRNLFMIVYPRMIEILHLPGSPSFLITPSEADFRGPLGPLIEQYLVAAPPTRTIG